MQYRYVLPQRVQNGVPPPGGGGGVFTVLLRNKK